MTGLTVVNWSCFFQFASLHTIIALLTWLRWMNDLISLNNTCIEDITWPCRHEISLRVMKNISGASAANVWNIFQHEKRNSVSPSVHKPQARHARNADLFYLNISIVFFQVLKNIRIPSYSTIPIANVEPEKHFPLESYQGTNPKIRHYYVA